MVSNIFYFHPYLGKIPILTNIFQMGWNHQLEVYHHPKGTTIFLEMVLDFQEPNKYDDDFESLRFSIFFGVLWGRWFFFPLRQL